MNCRISTSLRLFGMPQRKKRAVTSTNGKTLPEGKSEASVVARSKFASGILSRSPIQMNVAAIHEQMLSGGVACLGREQKNSGRSNFLRLGHSLAEWNLGDDASLFILGVRKSIEPCAIGGRDDLRRNNRIHPDTIREQLYGPLAGKSHNPAFRRSVTGSASLPSYGGLRSNVYDGALRFF